jgi:hypothetical protein
MPVGEYTGKISRKRGYYVYRIWSITADKQADRCLYVGCCQDTKRIQRNFRKPWVPEFIGIDVATCDTYTEMLTEKQAQIRELRPLHYRENERTQNASLYQSECCTQKEARKDA